MRLNMFSWMSVPAFFSCCEDGGDGEDHVGCQASEARLEPTAAAAVRRAYAGAAEMNYRAAWKMRREMGQKRARDASSEEEEVEAEEEEMSAPRNPGSPAAARRRRNRCESGSPLRLCRGRVSGEDNGFGVSLPLFTSVEMPELPWNVSDGLVSDGGCDACDGLVGRVLDGCRKSEGETDIAVEEREGCDMWGQDARARRNLLRGDHGGLWHPPSVPV